MTAATAHISVDLDPIDTHLAGYGLTRPHCDRIYRTSVPRILDLLDEVGVRATIFVVARDAAGEAALWRRAAAAGHEIASHSITHPIPFASLPVDDLERELRESKQRLEDAIGKPVIGFRAPGWDVDRPTLVAIAAAGYRYDASVLPSPALLPGAVMRFALSGGRMRDWSLLRSMRLALSPRAPYLLPDLGLWEFPVAVTPRLRLPFTHTLWYMAPRRVCERSLRALLKAGTPLCYQFHAVDLLDLADGIDPDMSRHPGMRLPLATKRTLLADALRALGAACHTTTYADAVGGTDIAADATAHRAATGGGVSS